MPRRRIRGVHAVIPLRRPAQAEQTLAEAGGEPVFAGLSPAMQAALAELSAGEREVIALRVLLDLDGETAARLLGISATACSTRLSRALKKLEEKVRSDVAA